MVEIVRGPVPVQRQCEQEGYTRPVHLGSVSDTILRIRHCHDKDTRAGSRYGYLFRTTVLLQPVAVNEV